MMTVAYNVRWRLAGSADPWQVLRIPLNAGITIPGLERAEDYTIEVQSIGANERVSRWVVVPVHVPDTHRVGALALPTNVVGNQASMWDGDTSVTYSAATDGSGDSEATISMSAGTLVIGDATVQYAASSGTVTGAANETATFYLYYDDPRFEGGSRVLGITRNIVETANVDGRVAISALTITFPAAGDSGSGGGGIGGGGGGGGSHNNPTIPEIEP